MLKETGYQEKFEMLRPYLESIIDTVKKDLKSEHWKVDRKFCQKYFFGKNPSQVPIEQMAEAYATDIAEGNIGLGEFIASRWLLKNTDLYGYFEKALSPISQDFDTLDELPIEQARPICEGAVQEYGWTLTYLFCVLNSVVFPEDLYEELKQKAQKHSTGEREKGEKQEQIRSIEVLKRRHARELAALTDKFEKKMNGLQKKYLNDVSALKAQIQKLKQADGV